MFVAAVGFILLLKPGPFPHVNGIFDAPDQRQLALPKIVIPCKSPQRSAFSIQPKMKKDIVWNKIKQWPVLVLRN